MTPSISSNRGDLPAHRVRRQDGELSALDRRFAESRAAAELTVGCAHCSWSLTGRTDATLVAQREHLAAVHPEVVARPYKQVVADHRKAGKAA